MWWTRNKRSCCTYIHTYIHSYIHSCMYMYVNHVESRLKLSVVCSIQMYLPNESLIVTCMCTVHTRTTCTTFNRTRCTVIMNVLRITACHVHVYNTGSKTCMLYVTCIYRYFSLYSNQIEARQDFRLCSAWEDQNTQILVHTCRHQDD